MASFNRTILVGNVTREIELRHLNDGTAVCEIGLAVNEKWKDAAGNGKEDVLFIDCTCWRRTAEIAAEYVRKGQPVLVEGRLKLDRWEKDGQKQSRIKLTVDKLVLLGSKSQESAPPCGDAYEPPQQAASPCAATQVGGAAEEDSEIPF